MALPFVLAYETWIELTKVDYKPRSSELKRIDAALQAYHRARSEDHLKALRYTLHAWKMSKGFPEWRDSIRNRRKGIEILDKQVNRIPERVDEDVLELLAELPFYGLEALAEEGAREAIRNHRQDNLRELLGGRRLVCRPSYLRSAAGDVATLARQTKTVVNGVREFSTAVRGGAAHEGTLRQILGTGSLDFTPETTEELIRCIAPAAIEDFAASMAPFTAHIRSGATCLVSLGRGIKAAYDADSAGAHLVAFNKGDPEVAAAALIRMIERVRNRHFRKAAISGTELVARTGMFFADGGAVSGPVIGAAAALARLMHNIFLIGRDIQEKNAANKVLQRTVDLDSRIFDVNPLLGCYVIACSNTSDIINMMVEDIGEIGWMDDIETPVKKHVNPMVVQAREFIADARFEVQGFDWTKGMVLDSTGFVGKRKKALMLKMQRAGAGLNERTRSDAAAVAASGGSVTLEELRARIYS